MERLTKRVGCGEAVPVADGNICAPFIKAGLCKTGNQGFPYGRWERHCNDTCVLGTIIDKLAAYEDTGLMPGEVADLIKNHGNAIGDLAWIKGQLDKIVEQFGLYHDNRTQAIIELLKMGGEGRLLPLPCPIGFTVYVIGHKYRAGYDECWINPGKFRPSDLEKIGDRVFLTYEDAKAKVLETNKGNARFRFIERSSEDG